MHFSALTVLACALVAVTARPVPGAATIVAPVKVDNVLNGNKVAVLNNVLNSHPKRHGDVASIFAPVKVDNVLNGNVVKAGNNIANNVVRDAAKVIAPVTIEEMFDCNDIAVANNILNNLAAELGCTILQLGITAQDILDVTTSNYEPFVAKLYANVQKADAMPKRDVATVYAPVTVNDILNCNTVEIANDILNNLAYGFKCTVVELGITIDDILGCHDAGAVATLLATVQAAIAHLGEHKRDLVNVAAPVDVSNVANYNVVDVLNNVGNKGHKRALVNVVTGLTATDIANNNNIEILNDVLNGIHSHKRDLVNVNAPVTASNIANYNMVDVLNNVGNKGGKRDLVNVVTGLSATNIGNGNTAHIADDILNN